MGRAGRWVWVLFFVVGCGRTIHTPLALDPTKPLSAEPEKTSKPLNPNPAWPGEGYCFPDSTGNYADTVTIEKKGNNGQHDFAEGGGCIARPLREVWAVTHNKQTLQWKGADLTQFGSLPDGGAVFAFLFRTKYEAGPFPFRQNWLMNWYHVVKEGSVATPTKVLVTYAKVVGTSYIPYWQGKIQLTALTPRTTSFVMHDEIKAANTGPENAEGSIRDVLTHLRNRAPVWDYLKE